MNKTFFLIICGYIFFHGYSQSLERSWSYVQPVTYSDTNRVTNFAKEKYTLVNQAIPGYTTIEKDIYTESSEGASVLAYFDSTSLKKIVTTFYGVMGQLMTEYYFENGEVFFIFRKNSLYNHPAYIDGSRVIGVKENRYYISNSGLVKWVGFDQKPILPTSLDFKNESEKIVEEVSILKRLLVPQAFVFDNVQLWNDTVRCKYGFSCLSTGYVLKGSRDTLGKVIHVNPRNKNVPQEE